MTSCAVTVRTEFVDDTISSLRSQGLQSRMLSTSCWPRSGRPLPNVRGQMPCYTSARRSSPTHKRRSSRFIQTRPIGRNRGWLCSPPLALQPVDESMGPTKFVPQSHTAAAHEAFNSAETKLAMLLRRPTWRGVLDTGEATLFDSRLIHCGGANESPRRRVLFYISFRAKEASAPPGTLLYDLRGRYSLSRSKSDGGSWALQDSHGATHWCHGEPSNRPDRVGAEP